MTFIPRLWLAIVFAAFIGGSHASAQNNQGPPPHRLALVIGSSAYRPKPLPTAANDAGLVAQALAQDGFEVTALADPDAATLRKTAETFADEVRHAGDRTLVFVYMSGVGVQYGGVNYVVPAPAAIERQADIPDKAVPFSDILRILEAAPARARVFVYDLAHPTPLATSEAIPLAAGLRHMQPSSGSLYAFNAAPGLVAPEDMPLYGTYARAWAEALRTPGLKLHALFSRVRLRVAEISGGADIPWDNGELDPEMTLVPAFRTAGLAGIANRPLSGQPVQTVFWAALAEDTLAGYQAFLNAFPKDPLAARVRLMKAVRLEAANWAESCRANTATAYWTYMQRYPRGPHYVDVRRRLAVIHAAFAPPMRFDVTELGGLPSPTAEELRTVDRPGSPFVDPELPAIPPPPVGLLPDPPSDIFVDLAPPPLPVRGALPVGFPIGPAPVSAKPGRIALAAVPEIERPMIETTSGTDGSSVMRLASGEGIIATTVAATEGHQRSIIQKDAAGRVVSRITVKRTGDTLTTSASGPDDRPLVKVVTRFSLNGDRATVVSDAAGRPVVDIDVDKRGVVKSVARGPGSIDRAVFEVPARPDRPGQDDDRAKPGAGPSGQSESRQPSPSVASPPETAPSASVRKAAPKAAPKSGPKPAPEPSLPPKSALRIRPAEPGLLPDAPIPSQRDGLSPPSKPPP